ncbi:MAG: hypothetical protein HQL72_14945 [Magnetococcales bacterium]|nr:hypothetical protein [Magnetococcales bacterium]
MEFFSFIQTECNEEQLIAELTMESLCDLCPSLEKRLDSTVDRGRYFTLWGEFEIIRQRILGGYRFFLPTCQNTLAWTITTGLPPHPSQITIHATINRTSQDSDFIETLEDFVQEWKAGLEKRINTPHKPTP